MTEELKQKAIENVYKRNPLVAKEWFIDAFKKYDKGERVDYLRDYEIAEYESYIAGATENGIQWHKNKKVPLCKGTIRIILYDNWREPGIVSANSELEFIGGQENHIIAWCEIPQFKE